MKINSALHFSAICALFIFEDLATSLKYNFHLI